jgi:exodeoxyribonuclease VII small subunit
MVSKKDSAKDTADSGGEDADQTPSITPISQLGYEECRDELIEVVRLLEQGGMDLDASLRLWEKGEQLAKRCEERLAGARQRVTDALAAGEAGES